MRDLRTAFNNCITMMDEIGIDYGNITEVAVNTRAKKRWGQCKCNYIGFYGGKPQYDFTINISSVLLDERVPIESLQNTIIHEILHTCPGCQNHGAEWKRRAAKVKHNLGYDIKRCSGFSEMGITDEMQKEYRPYKYMVQCKKCGRVVGRQKMCHMIKHPESWRCGVCSGEFERIL